MSNALKGKRRNALADDPMRGELGIINHPLGQSTERSITVKHPRLNRGRFTNIPSLVQGQRFLEEISAGELTPEQRRITQRIAIARALQRMKESGAEMPSYENEEEAINAAIQRSRFKDADLSTTRPYNAGVMNLEFGGGSPERGVWDFLDRPI